MSALQLRPLWFRDSMSAWVSVANCNGKRKLRSRDSIETPRRTEMGCHGAGGSSSKSSKPEAA